MTYNNVVVRDSTVCVFQMNRPSREGGIPGFRNGLLFTPDWVRMAGTRSAEQRAHVMYEIGPFLRDLRHVSSH